MALPVRRLRRPELEHEAVSCMSRKGSSLRQSWGMKSQDICGFRLKESPKPCLSSPIPLQSGYSHMTQANLPKSNRSR